MTQWNEMENGSSPDKQGPSPENTSVRKDIRYSVLTIDRCLGLKWGLALLGEERGKEYLQWLQDKLNRQPQ